MSHRQNAHLTFKGNCGIGRHGWLRLTPAYSLRLVRDYVSGLRPHQVVTDPFSGTGTTALAAVEAGVRGQALDINPFLLWLGRAKTRHYGERTIAQARELVRAVRPAATALLRAEELWQPPLSRIERWWSSGALQGLRALRAAIDEHEEGAARDLLDIAFCRTLISTSNAAFNHQSMSFQDRSPTLAAAAVRAIAPDAAVHAFERDAERIIGSAASDLPGEARFFESDSRQMGASDLVQCDLLLTSPPYVNRMSYIRELRPYMYWLRYLKAPVDASELDWTAIGGTWGAATSRLAGWTSDEPLPVDQELRPVCAKIASDGGRSGPLLAKYVRKYFTDMWAHFQAAYPRVASGGRATYIVGNSTFYGHLVPAEQWYRTMLLAAGFRSATVTTIRKRNSKKDLFEYEVTATKP